MQLSLTLCRLSERLYFEDFGEEARVSKTAIGLIHPTIYWHLFIYIVYISNVLILMANNVTGSLLYVLYYITMLE